jgi:hypothetical protein
MASSQGQVTLHGRFAPGTSVRLVKVRDESVLRAEGGKEVAAGTVDDDGRVAFKSGVEVGARYFICGHDRGDYREVRVIGRKAEDDTVLSQPPVGNVPLRTSGGHQIDQWGRVTAPDHEKTPGPEVAPGPAQHQVPKGTVQRRRRLRAARAVPRRARRARPPGTPRVGGSNPWRPTSRPS